ncbi:MAG: glycoside hydrolase family 31 protein, partial [Myxococcota bacterium]
PWPLVGGGVGPGVPPGLEWLAVTGARVTERSESAFTLALRHGDDHRSTLRVTREADGRYSLELRPEPADDIAYFRLEPRTDPEEAFYGLGEYFDDVNHRGKARAMQLELHDSLESSYNEAHVPVPFVLGTTGWGLFVQEPYPATFEMATEEPDRSTVTYGHGPFAAEGMTFHLFAADHPLDVTKHYYEVTGYPRLPARWALGPWIWRDENENQEQVEDDLDTIRAEDLATTGYWIDRPYATAVNTFDFDPAMFTDAQAMIDKMHELGFRVALWHSPYLDESRDSTQALRDEATAEGYYPPETGVLFNNWGKPIDLTNPAAYAWWQDHVRTYTDMGVEGFKLDYGEDVVPGLIGSRSVWEFADGSDERTMHALYQRFYHRVYAETLPEQGGFLLCRGGTYGDQVNVSVVWPGDLDANFARHGDPIPGEDQTYVGGLPASVIAGLTLGPSGFPFYGSDTGGYRHSPPDKETFTRWFEQTALSSVMQVGTSTNEVAWDFEAGRGGTFDEEMLDWYRQYTRLHLRLWPYEWTYAQRIAETGRPIQRALGLAYPELGVHPSDTYLFGDDLLVAPVLERGVRSREVTLPPGRWVDWWTGEVHDGGQTVVRDAPLGVLPLFLRAGGIVPMLRPTIDTMAPTTADPSLVDSYATTPGILYARIAPGDASTFTLFDGTTIGQEATTDSIVLGSSDGAEFAFGVMFEVIGVGTAPTEVGEDGTPLTERATADDLDAADSGYWFDATAAGGTLWVKVPAGEHEITITR